ncbi:MAG TPA: metallopeptidase TldD-related protein [Kofleriaceae bacterium]|nr:metallopeptidase TldD-related protein [Kofleriaceae bacterium]
MLTRDQARELVQKVLSHSKADEAEVALADATVTHLRFARNSPSTSGSSSGPSVTVRSGIGKKRGAVTVNQLDDATLRQAVARSEEMARLAPDDPEFVPALGPQEYADVPAYFETTAAGGARRMAEGVGATIEAARARDFVAAGFARAAGEVEARASSRGLFGYHRSSAASFSTTVRTPDGTGSGYAGKVARRIEDIDYAAAARTAVDKAAAARKPRALKPGKYVAVLEPTCVANLLQGLAMGMDRRRADEGRSFFAAPRKASGTRLGEKLFGRDIDIRSDPRDPRCPARPWGDDGVPQAARAWIDRGEVASLACDRFWAEKQKAEPVPRPSNLLMAGGKGTLADLIRSTRRGVLVTSFWYIRFLDPQSLTFTGLTRDGVFWIEGGEIAYPVNNFRWNESPVAVLKKVEAMSASELAPPRGDDEPFTVVPAIRTAEFNFASVSDAV